jgi:hypothetical protein
VPATRPTRRSNPHPGATSTCSARAAHLRPCRRAPPAGVRPRRRPADPSDHGVGRQHRDVGPAGARAACPGVPDHRLRRARNRELATPARPAAATQPPPSGRPPPRQPRPARRPRARRVVRGRCRPGAGPAQPPPRPPAGPGLHVVRDERWPFTYLQVYADAIVDPDPELVGTNPTPPGPQAAPTATGKPASTGRARI